MATPLTLETPVGYVSSEDLYISYREYYGDGTIYGRVELLTPEGEPVKGAGKTKVDLINANVVLGENVIGSIGGDLVAVPNEPVPEAAAPAVEEPPAECCCPCDAEVPAAAVVEEAPAAPVEEAPAAPVEEAPAVTEEAPAVTEEAPAVTEEAPAVTEEAPAVADCACGCKLADCSCGCKTADGCSCCSKASGECSCCCKNTGCACPCNAVAPVNNRYTVSLSIFGFAVNREFTVKIDNATRNIYLS